MSAPTKPYTIITAYHQEMPHWRLGGTEKSLIMAFVWCLKLRMDGQDPSAIFGLPRVDGRKRKCA